MSDGNGTSEVLAPATPYAMVDGRAVTDMTRMPTRGEVADALGCSVSKVRRLERAGKLHPIVDSEGSHRFAPEEVANLARDMGLQDVDLDASPEERKNALANAELSLARQSMQLLTHPRLQVDALLFRTIDMHVKENERLTKRVEHLEQRLDEQRERYEQAIDRSEERKTAGAILQEEERRKTTAWMAIIGKLERLIAPGTPFLDSLNVEQLELMSSARKELGLSEPQVRAVHEATIRKTRTEKG